VPQLYALRAQVEALIMAAEAEIGASQPVSTACPHPDEKRRDATTAGGPRQYLCLVCGQTVMGAA
jgi:hypothetical protein